MKKESLCPECKKGVLEECQGEYESEIYLACNKCDYTDWSKTVSSRSDI